MSPKNFDEAFEEHSMKILKLHEETTKDTIQNELLSFVNSWDNLKKIVSENFKMGIQDDLAELEGSDDDIEEGFGDGHKCSECAICVY